MLVVLNHDVNRAMDGFAAGASELGLSAHGPSPDLARRNLERLLEIYLQPFQREGILNQEISKRGCKWTMMVQGSGWLWRTERIMHKAQMAGVVY